MQSFCVTLTPLSAFATPLKGDTLFGQLCWAIRNRLGEARLEQCLEGYTENLPFMVVSDAFPENYIPLPNLPGNYYRPVEGGDRKSVKKRCWLPMAAIEKPVLDWLIDARSTAAVASDYVNDKQASVNLSEMHPQPHNTINRLTNTTGKDGFAPYSNEQEWFIPSLRWTVYLLLDSARLTASDCEQCLKDIGNIGFGRDASIGLGKFKVEAFQPTSLPAQNNANACLTLAPSAPQGFGFDKRNSFYQLFTRFGRHGDVAVHQEGKPFKNPILLAQTAAVFAAVPSETGFIGQGIGGKGELSKTLRATVHQGYAPIVAINVNFKK
ncbi:MAG: type III-A CRISPR-associated RAMP protein Csm4 [Methylobacter sp.]